MANLSSRAVLKHNFLFRGLPDRTIDSLAGLAHRRRFEKGAMIFRQGDKGDALYGVASGRIRILISDENGREVILNILGPGDTFGEIALLDGLERTATAVSVGVSMLLVIPRSEFLAYLDKDPCLSLHLIKLLCERLRWLSDRVEESAFLTGPARVAKRIVGLLKSDGRERDEGGIQLAISQAELGQFLGISRQVINQYLGCWSTQGWVTLRRGRIIVRDSAALRQVAGLTGTDET